MSNMHGYNIFLSVIICFNYKKLVAASIFQRTCEDLTVYIRGLSLFKKKHHPKTLTREIAGGGAGTLTRGFWERGELLPDKGKTEGARGSHHRRVVGGEFPCLRVGLNFASFYFP